MSTLVKALTPGGVAALVNVSFLILLFPLLDLWRMHILATVQRKDRPGWVRPILCYITLLTSMVLSIVIVIKLEFTVGMITSRVRHLWQANYALSVATVVMALVYVVLCHFLLHLGRRGTIYLVSLFSLCFITSLYRIVQLLTANPNAPVHSRAAFYILEGATDWLVLAAILAININVWFPGDQVWKKEPYEPDEAAMTAPAPSSDMVSAPANGPDHVQSRI